MFLVCICLLFISFFLGVGFFFAKKSNFPLLNDIAPAPAAIIMMIKIIMNRYIKQTFLNPEKVC